MAATETPFLKETGFCVMLRARGTRGKYDSCS